MDRLLKLKTALLTVTSNVFHYFKAGGSLDQYISYAEDSEINAVWADNTRKNYAIQGTIDYFTKTEFDSNVDAIEASVIAAGIGIRLNSVQREDDTGYIHYEWLFTLA